ADCPPDVVFEVLGGTYEAPYDLAVQRDGHVEERPQAEMAAPHRPLARVSVDLVERPADEPFHPLRVCDPRGLDDLDAQCHYAPPRNMRTTLPHSRGGPGKPGASTKPPAGRGMGGRIARRSRTRRRIRPRETTPSRRPPSSTGSSATPCRPMISSDSLAAAAGEIDCMRASGCITPSAVVEGP